MAAYANANMRRRGSQELHQSLLERPPAAEAGPSRPLQAPW
jgi:hypothetical protein